MCVEKCGLWIATAVTIAIIVVLAVVSYVWRQAHIFAYKRIQRQQEMNAETNREYEELLRDTNRLAAQLTETRKERDEAEAWNHQLAKDLKTKYGGNETTH